MNVPISNITYLRTASQRDTEKSNAPPLPLIINGRYLTRKTTGVERVARGIVDALDERIDADGLLHYGDRAIRARVVVPKGDVISPPKRIPLLQGSLTGGNLWEQVELPISARDGILLNLCNTAPLFAGLQTTYVHDAGIYAVSRSYDWRFRTWYRLLHRAYHLRDDILLTNSVFSARELQHYAGFTRDKLHVATPGCDHMHSIDMVQLPDDLEALSKGRGYFLVVASRAWHKSTETAVAAHSALMRTDPHCPVLVMIGGQRHDIFGHDLPDPDEKADGILRLGYVDDPLMVALLRKAKALIFPSRYEGFGLPLAEAMALECPVISSDLPTAREIGIDACWTFPTDDSDALCNAMREVMARPSCVAKKIAIGRARAANLSWDACADAVLGTVVQAEGIHRSQHA